MSTGLINDILSYLGTVETTSFTALGKYWRFRRVGGIVFLDAPTDMTTAVKGVNTIGTLPESMRPRYSHRINCGNISSNDYLIIETDGTVQYYAYSAVSSARNCALSTCYLVLGG